MPTDSDIRLTRRRLLQLGLALPLPMVLAACDDGAPTGSPDPAAAPMGRPDGRHRGRRHRDARAHPGLRRRGRPDARPDRGPLLHPDSPRRASLLEAGMGGQACRSPGPS